MNYEITIIKESSCIFINLIGYRLVLKYEGTLITLASKGTDFQGFKKQFGDNERCYGYIRLQVFLLVNVPVLHMPSIP